MPYQFPVPKTLFTLALVVGGKTAVESVSSLIPAKTVDQ